MVELGECFASTLAEAILKGGYMAEEHAALKSRWDEIGQIQFNAFGRLKEMMSGYVESGQVPR